MALLNIVLMTKGNEWEGGWMIKILRWEGMGLRRHAINLLRICVLFTWNMNGYPGNYYVYLHLFIPDPSILYYLVLSHAHFNAHLLSSSAQVHMQISFHVKASCLIIAKRVPSQHLECCNGFTNKIWKGFILEIDGYFLDEKHEYLNDFLLQPYH